MFAQNIRYLRKKQNMSQDKLAELCAYKSFTTIQKWEDGTAIPNAKNLKKLSDIFGYSVDELLNANLSKNDEYFYYTVSDNSLKDRRIEKGDTLLCHYQKNINDNDVAIIKQDETTALRNVKINEDKIILYTNNELDNIVLTKDNNTNVDIIGKVCRNVLEY